MEHVLVVGGTGMLGGLCKALLERGVRLTVVSRGHQQPLWLRHEAIHAIALDYRDTALLTRTIETAIDGRGRFDAAVGWVHGSAPEAPFAIARTVAPGRYLGVLGSAGADPSKPDGARRSAFEAVEGLIYQEAILGFEVEGGRSRWLTDAEISSGVLGALDSGAPRTIVGRVRPWSARP